MPLGSLSLLLVLAAAIVHGPDALIEGGAAAPRMGFQTACIIATMLSDRILRRIDALLDDADEAITLLE